MRKLICFAVLIVCATTNALADLRINEFMAANDTVLLDDDGENSDWIELYNDGAATNLNGWYLSDDEDDPTQWRFPSVEIPANGYLLLYASGKDRSADGVLHTNFRLGKGGEYLGLTRPDGVTTVSEFTPEYPAQSDDVSYGFAQGTGVAPAVGFLLRPTPNRANSELAPPRLTLVPQSGVFTNTQTVVIETDFALPPGSVIRYTTDGSDPTSSSLTYTAPIVLSSSSIVRAAVFQGTQAAAIAGGQYIEYASSLIGFESSLPIVVIDTFGESPNTGSDEYKDAALAFMDLAGGLSTFSGEAEYLGFGGIRRRGSSSGAFAKKSYKVELWDADRDDRDADLYGMGSESDWILTAPGNQDRSFIANPFMADLADDVGLSSLDWRYVEVFLNRNNGTVSYSDYIGIYLLFEQIKTGNQRIDLADLNVDDVAEPEISGGYIFKRDRADDDELAFAPGSRFNREEDPTNRVVVHRPKISDMNRAQTDWFEQHIRDFESALLGNQPLDPVSGYRAYIEENSWIDAHLLQLMAKNADMLKLSNFFYKEKGLRIVNGPLWDFDRSLNSVDERDDDPEVLFYPSRQVDPFNFSWWGELFDVPHFEEKHRRRWHVLRQGPLAQDALFSRIDALADPLFGPYEREDDRWGDDPSSEYGSRYGDFRGEIAALKSWLTTRLTFMDGLLSDPDAPDCDSTTLDYPLVANTWAMLSLPCEPPPGTTMATLFGDDISGGYDSTWVVYIFDPTLGDNGEYAKLSGDLLPQSGQGFWIIQTGDPLAILDLPPNSLPVSQASNSQSCVGLAGPCTSIDLPSRQGWAMLGNPHREAVAVGSMRLVGTSGVCSSGCTLPAGRAANIVPSPFYTYQREVSRNYEPLVDVGLLNEWNGFWAFVGPDAVTSAHTLQFPLSR